VFHFFLSRKSRGTLRRVVAPRIFTQDVGATGMATAQEHRREQISVPVDPAFRAALERAAESEHRTVANFVRHVVAQALEQREHAA
jgi:CopG antitoxin of type II toxin-antitoxin system